MSFVISKTNALPAVLAPSHIYFVRDEATMELVICVTNAEGTVAYQTPSIKVQEAEFSNIASGIIDGLKDAPGGLATIDSNGLLSADIGFNGQDTLIVSSALDYVWKESTAQFDVRSYSAGNSPTFGKFMGNFQGTLFSAGTMNQVWCDHHIQHDYAMGTVLFPHIHWAPTTNNAGMVRWGIEYMVAKGHGQQAFSSPQTIYIEQSVAANSFGLHCIAEVTEANAIPATNIEPDTFVKFRVFRDASHSHDTYKDNVHAWSCDLHYQIARLGTMNKSPDFFTH